MKKKIILLIISVLTVLTTLFAACNAKPNKGANTDSNLKLDKTSIEMIVGEEVYVNATYSGIGSVEWSSKDESVAIVNDGMVTAIKSGSTEITATYGKESKVCSVNVTLGSYAPIIVLDYPYSKNDTVAVNGKVNLNATVKYNGTTYTDGEFTYLVDSKYGTITNGEFTPTQKGDVEITVNCTWCGVDLPPVNVFLKVIDDIIVNVNGGTENALKLYTVNSFEGETLPTEKEIVVTAFVNGQQSEVTLSCNDDDIISFKNGEITAKKSGIATVSVCLADGTEISKITVEVIRPLGETKTLNTPISAETGKLPVEEIFGKESTIVEAYEDGKALTVEDGLIKNLETAKDALTNHEVTVYTEECGYTVVFDTATFVITKATDFDYFKYDVTEKNTVWDGYYYLANDINAEDYTHTHTNFGTEKRIAWSMAWIDSGLQGFFDGAGHTVNGITFGKLGLFGSISGGRVENVAFTEVNFTDEEYTCVLADVIVKTARIKNVYIQSNAFSSGNYCGAAAVFVERNATFTNCIIETIGEGQNSSYGSVLADIQGDFGNSIGNSSNCYVISTQPIMQYYKYNVGNLYFYGENETVSGDNQSQFKGFKRYSDYVALKKDTNDYSSFDARYWNLDSDIPTWKNSVADNYLFTANGTVVTVASLYNDEENNTAEIALTLFGDEITATFTIQDGADVISLSGSVITALKAGKATVEAEFTVDGVKVTKLLSVNVLNVAEKFERTVDFSIADGEFGEDLFDGEQILYAYINGEELTVQNGKIYGVRANNTGATVAQVTITVYSETKGYIITANAYDKLIKTAEDFAYFKYDIKNNSTAWKGHYALANDIDATGYKHTHNYGGENVSTLGWNTTTATKGLIGTFDGKGHTVKNLTIGRNGLFGVISSGTVKNVAFTNVSFENVEEASLFAGSFIGGTIQNVYVQANAFSNTRQAIIARSTTPSAKIENCVISLATSEAVSSFDRYGAIMGSMYNISKTDSGNITNYNYQNVCIISKIAPVENYVNSSGWQASWGSFYQVVEENSTSSAPVMTENDFPVAQYRLIGVFRYDDAANIDNNVDLTKCTVYKTAKA